MSKRPTREQAAIEQDSAHWFNWREFDPTMLKEGERSSLATELVTYRNHLDELLEHEGQFVVIKGKSILGYYRNRQAALKAAREKCGTVPALIKQIVEWERIRRLGGVDA